MYCPKCTLEIKGEDQKTCPICNSPLTDTPSETADALSEEELKLQELIADIDGKITGSDESEQPEIPEFQLDDQASDDLASNLIQSPTEPAGHTDEPEFKLNLETDESIPVPESEHPDKDLSLPVDTEKNEPEFTLSLNDQSFEEVKSEEEHLPLPPEAAISEPPLEPEFSQNADTLSFKLEPDVSAEPISPSDDLSVDLEKELGIDKSATDADLNLEATDESAFDLEKELGLSDSTEKSPEVSFPSEPSEETPTPVDFDMLPITEETVPSDEGIDDIPLKESVEDDVVEPSEILNKTLEELDPISEIKELQKKTSKKPLFLMCLLLVIIAAGALVYFKFYRSEKKDVAPVIVSPQPKAKLKPASKTVPAKPEPELKAKKTPALKEAEPTIETKSEPETIKLPSTPAATVSSPKPATLKSSPEKTVPPSETYSIHAGSFRKKALAQVEIERFGKSGFNGYIERVDLGQKGIWYRVKIGLYESRSAAKKAEKELLLKVKAQTRIVKNK